MRAAARSLFVIGALVAATGCGSSDSNESTTTVPAGTTSVAAEPTDPTEPTVPTPTTVDPGALPDTTLRAVLETTYPAAGFDEAVFGVAPGSVTAAWYAVGDRWAVHYDGLTPETASGKCPGNSIQTESGFEHISNSPYGALACSGYEDLPDYQGTILPPGSLFRCGESTIVYVTEIPLTAEGTLYGSLEQLRDDGVVQGMTSTITADADAAPEIDLTQCGAVS